MEARRLKSQTSSAIFQLGYSGPFAALTSDAPAVRGGLSDLGGVEEAEAGFDGGGDGAVNFGGGGLRTGGFTRGSPCHVPTLSATDPVFTEP